MRPDGRWEATVDLGYVNGHRQRKYFYGRQQSEAREKRNRWLQENAGLVVDRQDDRLRLSQWIEWWADNHPRADPDTTAEYKAQARRYINPVIGNVPITRLTSSQIEGVYRGILDRGLSPRTVRKTHETLRAALNAAVRDRRLPANPAQGVPLPEQPETDRRSLDVGEVHALIDHVCDGSFWYGPAIIVCACTGLRLSELRGLAVDKLDVDLGVAHVHRALIRRPGQWLWKDVKTRASRRTVPLIPQALKALESQRARVARNRLALGHRWVASPEPNADLELVFPREEGGPLAHETLLDRLHQACDDLGLEQVTLHELRHTFGSMMLSAGVPVHTVSRLMGHANTHVTERYYGHLLDSAAQAAGGALETFMAAGAEL